MLWPLVLNPQANIHMTIVGGSLGAKLISETVPAAIALLPTQLQKRLVIVQQTRAEYLDQAREIYRLAGVPKRPWRCRYFA